MGNLSELFLNHTASSHLDFHVWSSTTFGLHVVAAVFNLSLLIAVLNDRTSHPGPRLLIANLAFSSFLLSTIFLLPIDVGVHTGYRIPCAPYYVGFHLTMVVCSWADVALSVNRVIAICFPHHYDRCKTVKVSLILAIAPWLLAAVFVILAELKIGSVFVLAAGRGCSKRLLNRLGTFLNFMEVIGPCVIVVLASLVVFYSTQLRKRKDSSGDMVSVRLTRLIRRRLIIAKAMGLSALWCILCVAPPTVIVNLYPQVLSIHPTMGKWLRTTTVAEYAVNPVRHYIKSFKYTNPKPYARDCFRLFGIVFSRSSIS
ncbi:hypothetical protein RvY_10950-2 [Ramazzottius varieornatus]|uniref:G-protein coupled receptors family 1 profile domain-containing protein n=2 Tax=Ramazzottius varieornatus TaxID=947166 RepID=A0A1D1VEG9_RAMVA|nr:hypothetical protein RvY_10950-2 [Ramazzottius varieornatus]